MGAGAKGRTARLTGVLAGAILALAVLASPALAVEEHAYLPEHSQIDQFVRAAACGVTTDSAGDVYTSDYSTHKVTIYSSGGSKITEFEPPAFGFGPCSLAVDPKTGALYVDEFNGKVVKEKPTEYPPTALTTYALEESAGTNGVIVPKVNRANAVAFDAANQHLYVAEGAANELQEYTIPKGVSSYKLKFEACQTASIATSAEQPAGNIFVIKPALEACTGAGNVELGNGGAENKKAVSFMGALKYKDLPPLEVIKTGGNTKAATIVNGAISKVSSYQPDGTVVSNEIGRNLVPGHNYYGLGVYEKTGDVYVTDTANARAYILNPEGTAIVQEITGAGSPVGKFEGESIFNLAVDQSDGNVYVSHIAVYEFDSAGNYLSKIGPKFDGGLLELEIRSGDLAVDNGASSPNKGDVYVDSEDQVHNADSLYAFGPPLPKFALSLSTSGTGTGSLKCSEDGEAATTCLAKYVEGTKVEVIPTAAADSKFIEWKGDCSGSGACTVTMSKARSVNAVFNLRPGKTLTVTTSGNSTGAVTSNVKGLGGEKIECGTHCHENFEEGQLVKLLGTPEAKFEAATWTGCDAVNGSDECEVTMSAAKAVEAVFKRRTRKLTLSPTGPGTLSAECEETPLIFKACARPLGELDFGTKVKVTAAPKAGAELKSFSGTGSASTCESQGSPCSFEITEDSSVSAEFTAVPRALAIHVGGKGAGQVNCQVNGGSTDEPCAASYPNGTQLKLIAAPAGGSEFFGFSTGTGSASACATSPCEFTIGADSSLSATFIHTGEKTLKITGTGTGSGQVNCKVNGGSTDSPCAASYPGGTLLKLIPAPGTGSEFTGFSVGSGSAGSCSSAPCEFKLEADSALTARFDLITHTLGVSFEGEGEVECEVNGGSPEPCAAKYLKDTELELLARPKTHWAFQGWGEGTGSISCSGAGTCGPFALETDSTVKASFATVSTGAFTLPDERGWEMVSPPEKHGARIEPVGEDWLIQAAADGNALAYITRTAMEAEPVGTLLFDTQLATRSPAGGWSSRELALPHASGTGLSIGAGWEYRAFNADLSRAFVQPFGAFLPCESEAGEAQPCLSPDATEQTAFLASDFDPETKQPCSTDCYRPLVTGAPGLANVPPGTEFGQTSVFGGGNCPPVIYCGPRFLDATPDASHVLLKSHVALTESSAPGHPIPAGSIYEWSGEEAPAEQLRLISVLPGNASGEALPAEDSYFGSSPGGDPNVRHAISADGSRVVFLTNSNSGSHIYLRENATEEQSVLNGSGECTEPEKACTIQLDKGLSGVPIFEDADAGLNRFFFSEQANKEGEARGDLYEYDLATETLTRLTEGAKLLGIAVGASEDGDSIYFAGGGALAPGAVEGGDCASNNSPTTPCANLYLLHRGAGGWEAPRLIAVLSDDDKTDWGGIFGWFPALTAHVSPNGRYLAFMSNRPQSDYDNRDAKTGEPDQEVYEYDAASETLICASCNPTGARPQGLSAAQISEGSGIAGGHGWLPSTERVAANIPGWTNNGAASSTYQPRYLSDSGRLFFNAADALAPKDSNGTEDVYQYEPEGVGDCTPASGSGSVVFEPTVGACVGLISSGLSGHESAFLDASETGDDVFFMTTAKLSGRDFDSAYDVYDARVGGGETEEVKPVECIGDACQQPANPPEDPTPGSLSYSGPEEGPNHAEGTPTSSRCAKGKVHKAGRCVARHHKKAKRKKRADAKRRAGR